MAYDENTAKPHGLSLTDRKKLSISGVNDVSGFDENTVLLTTSRGELTVRGEKLHVDRIDLDAGQLDVSGTIGELSYDEAPKASSFWSRLFR
ncbi:MAG: sporulation protein YabP [Candidatus Limivicinus sp.]|jgi:sporulation protein YabP